MEVEMSDKEFKDTCQKALKYEQLEKQIAKHYEECSESNLEDIGLTTAMHFGYL